MVIIGIVVAYFVISMFMDEIPLLLLTLQLTFPLITSLGFDPIWFGVLSMLMVATGLVFPPVGLMAFVVSASAGVELTKVYKGCSVLMLAIVLTTVLVWCFRNRAVAAGDDAVIGCGRPCCELTLSYKAPMLERLVEKPAHRPVSIGRKVMISVS